LAASSDHREAESQGAFSAVVVWSVLEYLLPMDKDRYSEEEAQQRFVSAVKAALNTPPKPLKSMSRKRSKKQGAPHGKNKK
jgi:hypothetical protein